MPQTWRANSTTAICIPRQMPRNGIPFSRAIRAASTLPSIPRSPKPPGIRIPSAPSRLGLVEVLGGDQLGLDVDAVVPSRRG